MILTLLVGVILALPPGGFGPLLDHDEAQGRHAEVEVAGGAVLEVDGEAFLGFVRTRRPQVVTVQAATICTDATGTYGGVFMSTVWAGTSFLLPTAPFAVQTFPRFCMAYVIATLTRNGRVWFDLYTYRAGVYP